MAVEIVWHNAWLVDSKNGQKLRSITRLNRVLIELNSTDKAKPRVDRAEVTDLNCPDHSTTSKEMARGELW